jgi:hypothetical protein
MFHAAATNPSCHETVMKRATVSRGVAQRKFCDTLGALEEDDSDSVDSDPWVVLSSLFAYWNCEAWQAPAVLVDDFQVRIAFGRFRLAR